MPFDQLGRREFISLLGGAAAWPARGQQGERGRRVGVLVAATADDPDAQGRIAALVEALGQLGWTDGRNVRIDVRWATTNADDLRRHAVELAALTPDVIVAATGTATVAPLLQATRTVCLQLLSIRSAPASSQAWRGRAATRPASRFSNMA